ncbi:Zinc-finger double domain containing protein [Euroglyphus maynei]|uniref:Zinc-finger double domain containing protein n=1 Tax=Euroglyphus maynei TaxID=6958 RepID=A0A1Y3BHP7_EURMA|nr:Zinc-finger double domain containing protein [Euroglyphus maynei]
MAETKANNHHSPTTVINNVAESSINNNNDIADDNMDCKSGSKNYASSDDKDDNEIESCEEDFEYPSDFDPTEYEQIELTKEHKRHMFLLLNMIIPELSPLNSFKSNHAKSSKSKSSSNDLARNILTRLTCLIQFFNDFYRPQEIWPLLGRLPLSLHVDKSSKTLRFNEELDERKIGQLNKYFRCWLHLFYTCEEIIESIDVMEQSSLEIFALMVLNVLNNLRDSLPQFRSIFLDHWFPLELFERRFECFFRYDKIYQIIMQQLVRERILYQFVRNRNSSMEKELELKVKEIDQLRSQLSRLQSTNKKTLMRNKSQIITTQTANPQTQIVAMPSGQINKPSQPKSQLKSILLARPRSPVPSTTSESCSNSAYSSGCSSPQSMTTISDIPGQIQDSKPTSTELAEAVANKIHQTRCTTKTRAGSSLSNNKSDALDSEYMARRGRPRKLSRLNDSYESTTTNNAGNQNKRARLCWTTNTESEGPKDSLMQSIRPRFKMKQSLLEIQSTETVINKNSPRLTTTSVNAISQQQTGPLKPIVKMNSSSAMIRSKSLLDTSNTKNNEKSKSLIIKPLQIKTESATMSSSTTFENVKLNVKTDSPSLNLLSEIDNLASFYMVFSNYIKCRICNEYLEDMDEFLKHLGQHVQNGNVLQCGICAKIFLSKYKLTRHLPCYTGEKPFSCEVCFRNFSSRDKLNEHIKAIHLKKTFSDSTVSSNEQDEQPQLKTYGTNGTSGGRRMKNSLLSNDENFLSSKLTASLPDNNSNDSSDDKSVAMKIVKPSSALEIEEIVITDDSSNLDHSEIGPNGNDDGDQKQDQDLDIESKIEVAELD